MARILRHDAGRLLGNVPEEYVFRCCDGHILKNMKELKDALGSMTDEAFAYHSGEERNDFSNWVRDIIMDEKLARDLAKSPSRAQAAKSAARRIAFLSSKLV
ncbi:MAG: hypothetical protein GTO54_07300 [Nitrososphaeria archaeon]|nr:hypothetical protein [Nitrososphaeria archaeon]